MNYSIDTIVVSVRSKQSCELHPSCLLMASEHNFNDSILQLNYNSIK